MLKQNGGIVCHRRYLYFKPKGPFSGIEAMGIKDKVFSIQVKLRRPVTERPGGQTGSSVRHQIQRHVAGP